MKTILVVEDENVICEMLCELLRDEQYEVSAAPHGKEALARMAENRPDLVLSDLMMPVLDGKGLCQAMQTDPRYQAIPIIILSAVDHLLPKEDCHYAARIAKPFDIEVLLKAISQAIGTSN